MHAPDPIARNLATVDAHIQGEAQDPAAILGLYTDDVVLEVPARGLRFDSHAEIEANYRRMLASMAEVEITPLDRFATEERVVDECLVRFRITGDGLAGAPYGRGDRVELRLLHVFAMRDGLIARETVYEGWRRIG
ncbi:nuclear transport factor 2 family protein [Roseococcus thiosulfatophilus]|uniref:nuclear transport factor 2 family protein n=1 Tax=Roseococcus thiosulfatophilus TaxID=35813 RepID=UPI001A8E1958|nr:nuclear transport factor 2 family protein [Roseococcus thiosulfatophilus]